MEVTRIGGLDPYSNGIPQIRKPRALSSLPFMQGANGLANDLTRRGVQTAANLVLNPLLHLGGKRNIHAFILHQRQELSIVGASLESPNDVRKHYIDSLKAADQHDHRALLAFARR